MTGISKFRLNSSFVLWVALISIVGLGLGLRLHRLAAEDLWYDEMVSVDLSQEDPLTIIKSSGTTVEANPPLFDLLLYCWVRVAGISESAVRLPSVFFGVASILLIFIVGRRLFDMTTGILAASLLALSQFHIAYSQEARPYALMVLLSLALLYSFLRLQERATFGNEVAYFLTSLALLHTHMYGTFVVAALNLYVFAWEAISRRTGAASGIKLGRWLLLQALTGVFCLPWAWKLSVGVTGIHRFGGFLMRPSLRDLAITLIVYAGGSLALASFCVVFAVAFIPLRWQDLSGFIRSRAPSVDRVLLLAIWFLVPIALPCLVSYLLTPIYFTRHTITASVAFYLLGAHALTLIRYRWLGVALVSLLICFSALGTYRLFHTIRKDTWKQAIAHVEVRASPEDIVMVAPRWALRCVNYYSKRDQLRKVGYSERLGYEVKRYGISISPDRELWVVLWHAPLDLERLRAAGYRVVESNSFRTITVHRLAPPG